MQVTFDQDRVIVMRGSNNTIQVVFQGQVFAAVSSPLTIGITHPIVSHSYTGEMPLRRIEHTLSAYTLETDDELPRKFMPVFAGTAGITSCEFDGKIVTLHVIDKVPKVITCLAPNLERRLTRINTSIPLTVLGVSEMKG